VKDIVYVCRNVTQIKYYVWRVVKLEYYFLIAVVITRCTYNMFIIIKITFIVTMLNVKRLL